MKKNEEGYEYPIIHTSGRIRCPECGEYLVLTVNMDGEEVWLCQNGRCQWKSSEE